MTKPPIPREFCDSVSDLVVRLQSAIHGSDSEINEIADVLRDLRSQSESITPNELLEQSMVIRITGHVVATQQSLARVPNSLNSRDRIKTINKAYNSLDHLSRMLGILSSVWYPED